MSPNRSQETSGAGFATLPESPIDGTHFGRVIETQQPLIVPYTAAETRWPKAMVGLHERGIVSFCSLPLTTACRRVGTVGFGSREPVAYASAGAIGGRREAIERSFAAMGVL